MEINIWCHVTMSNEKIVLTGGSRLNVGYLELAALEGFTSESVSVSFFYNLLSGNSLIDSIGVESSQASSNYIFPVEKGSAVDTGFAWAPAENSSQPREDTEEDVISLSLLDHEGRIHQKVELPFTGHYARFFSEVFEDLHRAAEGPFGVDDPLFAVEAFLQRGKTVLVFEDCSATGEFEDSLSVCGV